MRRHVPLFLCLVAAGCHAGAAPFVAVAAADAATVAVLGRGGFDVVYSGVSGRDCSIVRLDRGLSYCRPKEAPPPAPEFCARTLGTADCYSDPAFLPDHPASIADGPARLTPAQDSNRTARWPF